MKLTRVSIVSGVERTRELPITKEQWASYMSGTLIQDAFPHLSADDREWIMSGITSEEWDKAFKENS